MGKENLETLLSLAKTAEMSNKERAEQRISFAYGNTKIENEFITRATVERAAASIARSGSK